MTSRGGGGAGRDICSSMGVAISSSISELAAGVAAPPPKRTSSQARRGRRRPRRGSTARYHWPAPIACTHRPPLPPATICCCRHRHAAALQQVGDERRLPRGSTSRWTSRLGRGREVAALGAHDRTTPRPRPGSVVAGIRTIAPDGSASGLIPPTRRTSRLPADFVWNSIVWAALCGCVLLGGEHAEASLPIRGSVVCDVWAEGVHFSSAQTSLLGRYVLMDARVPPRRS